MFNSFELEEKIANMLSIASMIETEKHSHARRSLAYSPPALLAGKQTALNYWFPISAPL